MHDCPECGRACYCDGEDHLQPAPPDCLCAAGECEEQYNDDEPVDEDVTP